MLKSGQAIANQIWEFCLRYDLSKNLAYTVATDVQDGIIE